MHHSIQMNLFICLLGNRKANYKLALKLEKNNKIQLKQKGDVKREENHLFKKLMSINKIQYLLNIPVFLQFALAA